VGRGWSADEWETARVPLTDRGWLDATGQVSAAGADAHAAIETATDRAAARPWSTLGDAACSRLATLLGPLAASCRSELPFPNPIGVPDPSREVAG
jgi:hypothetical protein